VKNQPPLADPVVSFAGFAPQNCTGIYWTGVLREEETEKQGIASGIALGSPCFSGEKNIQGFSETTTKNMNW
jgi:hypothetical protein